MVIEAASSRPCVPWPNKQAPTAREDTNARSFSLGGPFEGATGATLHGSRQQDQRDRHVLARVTTDDGVEGFGYVVLLNAALVKSLADATRELSQLLKGMHVFEPEASWAKLVRAANWVGPGGFVNCAIAPLDIAMWDAAAKTANQPLYRLLGGFRDRVPAYASDNLWYSLSLDALAASAQQHVADGFNAVKLRIGNEATPQGEVGRVMAVREAVGDGVRILVDATETWEANQALQTGRALQDAGIHWLEDPIDHQNVAGLSRLANVLHVPIATGEHLYTIHEFTRLFEARGAGIGIIDLARIGGITPWRRVASLAQASDVRICGHVLPELHIHLLAAIRTGTWWNMCRGRNAFCNPCRS